MSEYVGKTNWQLYEIVTPNDMNRIEKRIMELEGEVENVAVPLLVTSLSASAWVQKDFYFEQTVPTQSFQKNVQPIITVDPDTLLQIITEKDCLLCINEQGKIKFRAYGVKQPETSIVVQIAQLFVKLDVNLPTPNFYSNMLGVNPVMSLELSQQISNLQAEAQEGEQPVINLSWTNPEDENFSGVKIVVKQGSQPTGVTDGAEVYAGSGTSTTYTAHNWDVTYYFRAFAYNALNAYQTTIDGAVATATPSTKPAVVTDFQISTKFDSAILTWNKPESESFLETVIVQKENDIPQSIEDGTVIYRGTALSTTSEKLTDKKTYYWRAFAMGKNGKYDAENAPYVTHTFDLTPKSWLLVNTFTNSGNYSVLERGLYKLEVTGSGGTGGSGKYEGPDIGDGGYDGYHKVSGGGGGGCGGYSESQFVYDASQVISCVFSGNRITCMGISVTGGENGSTRYGGSAGSASGGNITNVKGEKGSSGGYDSTDRGMSIYAAGGSGGRTAYSYGGDGGSASGSGAGGSGSPGSHGNSGTVKVYKAAVNEANLDLSNLRIEA